MELFNDDESINHHGFKRMVPEKENRVFTVRKYNEDTDTIKEIPNNGLLAYLDFVKDKNIGENCR